MATIPFMASDQERERVEALARQRGFTSVDDYLRALIEADVEQHGDDLRHYTAAMLLAMPEAQRGEILSRMAALAEHEYRNNPDLTAFNADGDLYDYPDVE